MTAVNENVFRVGYRIKSDGAQVAFMLSRKQLEHLGNAPCYSLFVRDVWDTNRDLTGREIQVRPHPEGYDVNYKRPDSPQGEINVAFNVLDIQPPTFVSPGELSCSYSSTRSGLPAMLIDVFGWIDAERDQMTIGDWGSRGRLLLPRTKAVIDNDPVLAHRIRGK